MVGLNRAGCWINWAGTWPRELSPVYFKKLRSWSREFQMGRSGRARNYRRFFKCLDFIAIVWIYAVMDIIVDNLIKFSLQPLA